MTRVAIIRFLLLRDAMSNVFYRCTVNLPVNLSANETCVMMQNYLILILLDLQVFFFSLRLKRNAHYILNLEKPELKSNFPFFQRLKKETNKQDM